VVTASGDQTCRLWDVEARRNITALRGHTGSVKSVATTAAARWAVATGARDGGVGLWDLRCPSRRSARVEAAAAAVAARGPNPLAPAEAAAMAAALALYLPPASMTQARPLRPLRPRPGG